MDDSRGTPTDYFEFTTVFMYKKVHCMNDDALDHRAKVDYPDETTCEVRCSCGSTWKVAGINPSALRIQQSFDEHLTGDR